MDTDSQSIGIDNRASACISHVASDFIGPLYHTNTKIIGYNGTKTGNLKIGTLRWKWSDDQGRDHIHTIPNSYYSPDGRTRLLSPQHWSQTYKGKHPPTCTTTSTAVILQWDTFIKTIPLGSNDNVATLYSSPGYDKFHAMQTTLDLSTIEEDHKALKLESSIAENEIQNQISEYSHTIPNNINNSQSNRMLNGLVKSKATSQQTLTVPTMSTNSQKLLMYHYRYKHAPFNHLRTLAKQNIIPKELANCPIPPCIYCIYGRATRRPWRTKRKPNTDTSLHADKPGQCVSIDMLTSPTPGFVAQMVGSLTHRRYKHSTVFIDHFSVLSYVSHNETASAEDTIKGKKAFEAYSHKHGVNIKQYHTDNGIFRSQIWQEHCIHQHQILTIAGVNAHYQNGRAERRIRILQDIARTQLIQASHHWPTVNIAPLWPYAILCANNAINNIPNMQNKQKLTPLQLFSSTTIHANPKDQQPFACPTYVLKTELQQLKPFHKWAPRSRMGIYLGTSPQHARTVALVLDTFTGLVSPQFHVVSDPTYSTAKHNKNPNAWSIRAGFLPTNPKGPHTKNEPTIDQNHPTKRKWGHAKAKPNEYSVNKSQKYNAKSDKNIKNTVAKMTDTRRVSIVPTKNTVAKMTDTRRVSIVPTKNTVAKMTDTRRVSIVPTEDAVAKMTDTHRVSIVPTKSAVDKMTDTHRVSISSTKNIAMAKITNNGAKPVIEHTVAHRGSSSRSTRAQALSTIKQTSNDTKVNIKPFPTRKSSPEPSNPAHEHKLSPVSEGDYVCDLYDLQDNSIYDNIYVMKSTTDPDSLYYHEAMRAPDKDKFLQAMDNEMDANINKNNISLIHRSDIPPTANLLPAVWQLRRKRNLLTGEIKRYKARLNVDGSRMVKHRDYDLTYAPVISWGIIRLLLTISIIKKWPTRQLDYVLAFPQAPIEKELYLKIPSGYNIINGNKNEYALKVHNNLYGQKQAGRVWHEYLIRKLTQAQFTQSRHDPCVLYRQNVIYILYTDDSIIMAPTTSEINNAVRDIRATGLELTDEGEISDFLGVRVTSKDDKIILTQEHLINQILTDLNFQPNTKTKETPSSTSILKRQQHSPPHDNSFNYRSIIGKLGYLEKGCRPDISYITHQCARFAVHPTQDHAKAVRWIAKYLKSTKTKGIILNPNPNLGLEVYVDADFAGAWDKHDTPNPDTARSRHGYVIKYAGCPIIWKSQLQTEFALSTTEAEYTGMSYALRETIPMMEILKELEHHSNLPSKTPTVKCRVFEDNSGAVEIASVHKYRPRTKHLNIRLHHFRDYVTNGLIKICKIDTDDQMADILTKPVQNPKFQTLRAKIMGW